LNQQKMIGGIDFRASAGRESLRTTDNKKSNFHMAKSRNANLIISVWESNLVHSSRLNQI
jgi:hypothetical protein